MIVVNGILFPPSRARLLQKPQIPVVCFGTEAPYFLKTGRTSRRFTCIIYGMNGVAAGFPNAQFALMPPNPATHQPGPDADKAVDAAFVAAAIPNGGRC